MQETEEEGWRGFIELCHSSTQKELAELLALFLTFEEKKDLSMRYWIVKELLEKRKSQRQIAKDLNVSISKITRGSNALKQSNQKLREYLLKKLL